MAPQSVEDSLRNSPKEALRRVSLFTNVVSFVFVLILLAGLPLVSRSHHLASATDAAPNPDSEWWLEAAAEAQRAAQAPCSGHGRVYVDSLPEDECECNTCFTGSDCSQRILSCKVDVDSGEPLFLEPFWESNTRAAAVVMAPTHRMSYSTETGRKLTKQLEMLIRQIHKLVGNAVTENRFIVVGTGSMELINAAVASLAPDKNTDQFPPAAVVSRIPYYSAYELQTEFFSSPKYSWEGDPITAARKFSNSNRSYIELIAAPNNPDGSMLGPVLNDSLTIYDRAYYWPHFTPITGAVDDDVTLFTLSKLTGHAGSRLGWAIVKDSQVYEKMFTYVSLNTIGVSHDTQLRAAKILKAVLAGYNNTSAGSMQKIFHFGNMVMGSRWKRLTTAFQDLKMVSVLNVNQPQPCLFFKEAIAPAPAYAWVRCEDEAITDCNQFFMDAGIVGRAGPSFGADSKHIRFAILKGEDDFELFIERLLALSNGANGATASV